MKKSHILVTTFIIFFSTITLSSCGKNDGNSPAETISKPESIEQPKDVIIREINTAKIRESFESEIADNFLGSIPRGGYKNVNTFFTEAYEGYKMINNCYVSKWDYGVFEIAIRRDNLISLEYETVSSYQVEGYDDECINLENKLNTEVLIKKSSAVLSIDNLKNSIKSLIERKINELDAKHDGDLVYAKNKDRHLYDVFSINDTNKIFVGSPDQSYFMVAIPQKGYLHFFNQKFHSSLNDFLNLTDKRQHPNKIFTEEILPVDENNFFQHALDN